MASAAAEMEDVFALNQSSGMLTTVSLLDRESRDKYVISGRSYIGRRLKSGEQRRFIENLVFENKLLLLNDMLNMSLFKLNALFLNVVFRPVISYRHL